jgi:hypothetical protein
MGSFSVTVGRHDLPETEGRIIETARVAGGILLPAGNWRRVAARPEMNPIGYRVPWVWIAVRARLSVSGWSSPCSINRKTDGHSALPGAVRASGPHDELLVGF